MAIHKDVDPRGFLLNDNDAGVDHLGKCTFADAIAESVHQVDTPITIGLYARWGSGKSFLLRQLENILKRYEKQDIVDEKDNERYSENCLECSIVSRAILWTSCVLLVLITILVTFLLALKPEFLVSLFGITIDYAPDTIQNSTSEFISTTVTSDVDTKIPPYIPTMKIIGMVLVPLEILAILFIGCCGNKWFLSSYYGSFRLLTYGAFTKLPIRSVHTEIVEDPGQHPALVLKHIRPGDERLAIAASEAEIFPRRYIFVDFKAWEYAGSDTLWAGIVTNIMDAIEAEFGVITARLFRMLTIEEIPKNKLDRGTKTLVVRFAQGSKKVEVLDMMKQYGVVTKYDKIDQNRWRVVFSSDGEFRNAKECLAIEGVSFEEVAPEVASKIKRKPSRSYFRKEPSRESKRNLLNRKDDVEMKDLNDQRVTDDEKDALKRLKLPPRTVCCNRFCSHFLKYPTKLLCMPRLVWWILIAICSILVPITAYIITDYLNLDIYRTYRTVPVSGQILLWLPAGIAVPVFVCKFVWAMCHSQRKRIHQALDGAKTKMAEELGFMDKVKNEIQVITKLIRCARFTHQKDYKIVITIDDLDRVPLKKIQSVLEAVSILLSDKAAPFICFIAVDPRIVVKCIEEGLGGVVQQAKLTGHEYLKKIINLPICLPEISDLDKKRFIAGLIDQADHTITYRAKEGKSTFANKEDRRTRQNRERHTQPSAENVTAVDGAGSSVKRVEFINTAIGTDKKFDTVDGASLAKISTLNNGTEYTPVVQDVSGPTDHITEETTEAKPLQPTPPAPPLIELNHRKFLFHCRTFIYNDQELHQHLQGNPRNIKRLFNVISLTACIIDSFFKREKRRRFIQNQCENNRKESANEPIDEYRIERTEEFAEDLVRWIVLADQWPYRTSYILQVLEDAEQRGSAEIDGENIPDDWTIMEIFQKKVSNEYEKADASLLYLDGDPDIFYSYLRLLERYNFTKQRLRRLEKYTVNLDYSIRHNIAFCRDLSCFKSSTEKKEANDTTAANPVQQKNGDVQAEPVPREIIVNENVVTDVENHRRHSMPGILEHC